MTWITIAWPMAIAACVTMGLIQLRVGFHRTPGAAHLLFALNALVVAVYSYFELALARAESPAQYLALLRWLDITAGLQVVTIAAFVWVFFGTGRKWLALLAAGLSCVALIADLLPEPKLVYLQLTGIRELPTFGGATYTVADGARNPWNAVFYLGVLLLVVFVADASVALWRRGARRRAAVVGGAITFFVLAGGTQAALVDGGILRTPYLLAFGYLAILVAMGLELSNDVLKAAQLAHDLREGEQRLALATDAANLGIWIRDLVRKEIWATDRWRALSGFSMSERIDLEGYLQKLHPEDREAVRQTFTEAVESDDRYETEYRVVLPDGQMRWLASSGRVEFDGSGKPVCVRGASLDITERKLAELEAQQHRNEVAYLARVSTMGEISASIAHELNQPLTAILTNAQAAQRFMAGANPDTGEFREILKDIIYDTTRARDVIRHLRSLVKRSEREVVRLDVNETVQQVERFLNGDIISRNMTVRTEFAAGLPFVLAGRVQVQQVLLNLLMNAFDAMTENPAGRRQVEVMTALQTPQTVLIAVRDQGHGISPDMLDKVFEAFYTSKTDGMGMGLAVSRSIIELHGGRLWAENNIGGGATFYFTLPAIKE